MFINPTIHTAVRDKFDDIYKQLTTSLKKCVDIASEKGGDQPISPTPFHYGWRKAHLPTNCVCGKPFTVEHALSCSYGGFPTIRHNELRNVTASLLSQVCSNVQVEPQL